MADFVVSSILDLLKTTIIDKAKEEAGLLLGVKDEIKKLERNLKLISAVLVDAEEKKVKPGNELLKLWIDSLKEACFDMEDALNEWRTAVELKEEDTSHLEEEEEMAAAARSTFWNKVCGFVSCLSPPRLISRHGVAVTIKEINERLDEIAKGRNRYQLEKREINENSTWRETSSFVEESNILGREEEKGIIVSHLLGSGNINSVVEEDGPIKTISLVGMGGLGKTAMAQLVYNDQAVREHFNGAVIWVCVSDTFDEIKVVKAIIESLGGREANTWQALLERLSESVREKKFFLVLDDVWGDKSEKWEELITCFKKSVKGSSILVSTRKVDVAKMMGSSEVIHLEKLGDEACWSIIKQKALRGRHDNNEMLEKVGREIAAKCDGLPLAAKTLASLLEGKEDIREWENVLNSRAWNLDSMPQKVFAPLMLSYHDLPLEVRRCYLFCVFYPKDHEIRVDTLINHWMSHDYLGFDNYVDLELKGQKYFNLLANRSFFQDFDRRDGIEGRQCREGNRIVLCKMHDIVHDFASYLVENEFATEILQPGDPPKNITLQKCRHFTMLLEDSSSFPQSISGAKTLRGFRISFPGGWDDDERVVGEGLSSLLKQSKALRLLDLDEPPPECLDQVLKEAGNLIQLRQLWLCYCDIKQLPETLSNLRSLIILDLRFNFSLEELPSGIGNLKNLKFLDTRDCWRLGRYPKEIGLLTSLECLHGAIVRVDGNDDQEFSFADFGNLRHLCTLSLEKINGEHVNEEEVKKARFSNLRKMWVADGASESVDLEAFIETMKHLPSTTIDFYLHII